MASTYSGNSHDGMVLGKTTPSVPEYSPDILFPISRAAGRESLATSPLRTMRGADLWHAYELSWLQADGKPVSRVGRMVVPASSPSIVESKSLKLYLNSLNLKRFDSEQEAVQLIQSDVGAIVGAEIQFGVFPVDDPLLQGASLTGLCIDDYSVDPPPSRPDINSLQFDAAEVVEGQLYSHLLRSLCPVTGQPDWATLWLSYKGRRIEPVSFLRYLLSYREHQEFHEQCVERMFIDLCAGCQPEYLHLQAFYTRRGGLDINPLRSTDPEQPPLPRLNRQ